MAIIRQKSAKDKDAAAAIADKEAMKTDHTCCCIGFLVGVGIMSALISVFVMKNAAIELTELCQVHVVLSHGERTPTEAELAMLGSAPERNVTYAPYGMGSLTNEGKLLMYEMGSLLRSRYEEFLGNVYYADDTVMQCTDDDVAKQSALLALAGLWPPAAVQRWKDSLLWQPVPYTYLQPHKDYMLYQTNCPRYQQEKQRILKNATEEGLLLPYRELFHRLSLRTSLNITQPAQAVLLKNLFVIQEDIKVPNPKWAKQVKRKLLDIARLEYNMMFQTNLLKKLSGGALLYKIMSDAQQRVSDIKTGELGSRIFLYTGGTDSVAALLATTGVARPHQPEPGAAFIVELHYRRSTEQYGVKIFYWDDDSAEPRLVEVPDCRENGIAAFCPIEEFMQHMAEVLSCNYQQDCRFAQT